jgi:hypothetical protein
MVASPSKHLRGTPPGKAAVFSGGGVKYVDRPDYVPAPEEAPEEELAQVAKPKKKRKTTPKRKHDPAMVKAARELRDRYLDAVNSGRMLPPAAEARYEVRRQLPAACGRDECADAARTVRVSQVSEDRLLDAA